MSDTPPNDPKTPSPGPSQGASPEPFVRGRIVWGRPPETVFRAGPLPRPPQSWSQPTPRPQAPRRSADGILSGSLVPGPASSPAPALDTLPSETDVSAAPAPEPTEASPEPSPPADAIAAPDASIETEAPAAVAPIESQPDAPEASEPEPVLMEPAQPEPVIASDPAVPSDPAAPSEALAEVEAVAVEPQPAHAPRPALEIIVEPEAPELIDTAPPLSSPADAAPADPKSMPSVVVTPTLYARVEAVVGKVKRNDRWMAAALIGAVVVTGGFIWLATLPAGDAPPLDMDAPPPAAPGADIVGPGDATDILAAVEAPSVVPTEAITAAAPAPAEERPTAVVARPTPAAPRAATPTAPVRQDAPAAVPVEPDAPDIEPEPLIVPPPTAAQPAPTDPDAPIETRPQPLN
jgi:hypothetical protein